MARLTPKRKRFVEEYLVDLNATKAAIRAGFSPRTAYSIGSELLTKPEVEAAIMKAQAERSRRTGITADRVANELARIGFADITDVTDVDSASLRDGACRDDTAAIQSIKVRRVPTEEGDIVEKEIRMYDKTRALEQLGRHLGIYNDKVRLEGGVSVVITDDLAD